MTDTTSIDQPVAPATGAARLALYVPRILHERLAAGDRARGWIDEGTAVFVDISGFTSLSEALASKGREGAEQITDIIGRSFGSILAVAYDAGGSLLKFGGDALLLWFQGDRHLERACGSALASSSRMSLDTPDTPSKPDWV